MARSPRRWLPKAFWFVTVRCIRSEYRLRPDNERRELVGHWLARAQQRHPGVRVIACVQMSNHLHLLVQDRAGQLSQFMQYALGHLAKDINRLDGERGPVFERRFSPGETIDSGALLERIAYALTNPIAAGLVEHPSDWPGLLLVGRNQAELGRRTYRRFRRTDFERAQRRAVKLRLEAPCEQEFIEQAELQVELPEGLTEEKVRAFTESHIEAIRAERGDAPILGKRKVLKQSPFGRPRKTKRSPRPLCHASTKDLWLAYLDGWRTFVRRYREASKLFRSGVVTALFPEYSYRPSMKATAGP